MTDRIIQILKRNFSSHEIEVEDSNTGEDIEAPILFIWEEGLAEVAADLSAAFEERLREELIKYDKWLCSPSKWGINNIPSPTECVDEYLKAGSNNQ